MSQSVTIEILGKSYTLQTDADAMRVSKIVDILKKEVARVEKELTQNDPLKTKDITVLLLAALNIAGVNHEIETKLEALEERMRTQRRQFLSLTDTQRRIYDASQHSGSL